ncbi:MAG: copper amine oxidase N-terminal domain-containing protein [Clostridia bacterium]|nr:copper amine oxidase N-terminal domain-containing protein [Clostridia bacterium]
MKKIICLLMSALLMFGMLTVAAFAADDVVYVDYANGADTNDGLSADTAKKSIDNKKTGAMQITKENGGTIVASGKLFIGGDYTLKTNRGGETIITGSYNGIDYRNPTPATNPASGVLKTSKGATLTIATDVTLTDIILFHEYDEAATIKVADGAILTITDTVVCMSKGSQYYNIVVEEGGQAIINGGTYTSISGDGDYTVASNVIINSGYSAVEAPGYGYINYASGSDGNDGLSASGAKKLFGTASGNGVISLVANGGTVVVSGKAYLGADYTIANVGAPITFTSNYGGVDYKNAEPAANPACALKLAKAKTLTIDNDVIFDNIILFEEYDTNTIIVKSGVTLTFTDTVVFMSKNGTHWTVEVESGANLVLSEDAKEALTVVNKGGNVTDYVSENKPAEPTVVKLTIGNTVGYVNGAAKTLDAAPIIRESRTMLPVRFVAEAFGAEVKWDGATSTASVITADTTIEITIGATTAKVNGQTVTLDAPAFIENSRTYLPVRFVAENLGATVAWDGATSTATLTK